MRSTTAAALVLALLGTAQAAPDPAGFARAAASKLMTKKVRPQTHDTDFQGDSLGCITFTSRELRYFGYAGHAFFCEDAGTGEILGAVQTRAGVVRCYISGDNVGDGCYDLTICGIADGACVGP